MLKTTKTIGGFVNISIYFAIQHDISPNAPFIFTNYFLSFVLHYSTLEYIVTGLGLSNMIIKTPYALRKLNLYQM